jgi:hypothetical protein
LCILPLPSLAESAMPVYGLEYAHIVVARDGATSQAFREVSEEAYIAFLREILLSGFAIRDKGQRDGGVITVLERDGATIDMLYDASRAEMRVTYPPGAQIARENPYRAHSEGDVLTFGRYAGRGIRWTVLRKEEDSLLLLSEKAIDAMPYNETYEETTWETCTLNAWLNGSFLRRAFSAEEAAYLTGGVFLLSKDDLKGDLQARATPYAKKRGAHVWENGFCWWYLADAGYTLKSASVVRHDGSVFYDDVHHADVGVRPAIRIHTGE